MSAVLQGAPAHDTEAAWKLRPLAEVAEILDSRRVPVNAKEREGRQGSVPYYGATGQVGWIDEFIFDEELVLLGEDGAPFLEPSKAKAYVIRGKSWVNNHAHVLRARGVPTGWLAHYLNLISYDGLVTGTTRLKLTQAAMRQIRVPVAPLHVMTCIVAEIEKQFSRLDEAVANLKRVKANLKRYNAAVLKAAVEGRLVPTEAELARREGRSYETGAQLLQRILEVQRGQWRGKGKYKEPDPPDTTGLPQSPEGWVWASVSQIADVASGNTPSGVLTAVRPSGELPWFKVGDMNHIDNVQVMRHAEAWLNENEAKTLGLRIFAPPTILFPKRGGAIATNKKRRLASRACADLNIMGITPAHALAAFFFTWFDGIDLATLSDGSNVPQINHKDIDPLAIPLPPLDEQHRIVTEVDRRLSLVRELDSTANSNHMCGDALRRSLLAQSFSSFGLAECT